MKKIEFGVRVPNSGPLAAKNNLIKAAQEAERLGFDTVWVHDHVVWSSEMHKHHISSGAHEALQEDQEANFFEALTTLAYLAAETKTIQLGVACLVMPCRNPVYAAKQTATLDCLCDGRLVVGVGLGSKATRESSEFEVFGVPIKGRGYRTDEYIRAMKAVWTQPLASYEGKHISFKNAEVYPKPVQKPHPPVWVGGWMDQAAVRAGRYGEGWIPGWLSPKEMKRGCDILAQAAKERGRDPSKITIAVEKLAAIARTRDDALNLALPTIRTSTTSYERDVESIQFALERHIIGSVDDIRRRCDEFIEAGVQHFELKLIYPSMESMFEQMTLWSKEIIPHYA
ncbi:MAG TPA: TIGR03619 family F420-dependent LLM class oxidoreductase [Candidatus Binatia bacterium]|jgi:probable F420-dependent oxidoreductase|nr:TIGR03619 family F420-dependent LLM class oxidoreductase [Candidatus Binatia bacterium]